MKKPKTVKNKLKESKAITLIALIITIIVLLILAGVTIAAISGNESVLDKAQDAKSKTDISSAKEAAILKATEYIQDYYQGKFVNNDSSVTTYTTAGAYVAKQFETQTQSGNYYIKTDANTRDLKISLDASQSNVVVEGKIEDNGTITWGEEVSSTNGGDTPVTPTNPDPVVTEPVVDESKLAKNVLTLKVAPNDNTKFISPYVNYTLKDGTTVLCRVLYNNGTNVEIIPLNPVAKIPLGWADGKVTTSQVETEKATLPNGLTYQKYLGGDFITSTSDEYAISKASYNNVVLNLNEAATEYMNERFSSRARCIGSELSSLDTESYFTDSKNYQLTYKIIGGNYYKALDENYQKDFSQLEKIDEVQITDSNALTKNYWLASRDTSTDNNSTYFHIRYISAKGELKEYQLCTITWTNYTNSATATSYKSELGLRPVFNLKDTVKVKNDNNDGSEEHPYNLE